MSNSPLKLTDFMDLTALQEMQDGFAAIASVKAVITDADGKTLTNPDPTTSFLHRRDAIAQQEEAVPEPQRVGREYVAPIVIGSLKLGQIRMSGGADHVQLDDDRAARLAKKFGLDVQLIKDLVSQATKDRNRKPAAIQFLFLLANAIARLCYQEYQLRHRIIEVETLGRVTSMLAQAHELKQVLDRTTEIVAELLEAKACSIRLLDPAHDELVIQSVHNLSGEYIGKGRVKWSTSQLDQSALGPDGYAYVEDMRTDERVIWRDEAGREGLVSMLLVGMRIRGEPVGVLRVYTDKARRFSNSDINLVRGIATTAATAIENTRLYQQQTEARQIEEQINMAADVQQRMVPRTPPTIAGLDLASVYVPCYRLGGDLFDFIELPYNNLGIAIADVSGKGVPASLIMASVRAALRAQVDNVYYLDEVVRRLNMMLYRDTKATEFVSLFYGVLDTSNMRLTYCNAGHLPAMLLRDGQVSELGSGDQASIVLGVLEHERFKQSFIDLKKGDTLLLYTDGLNEARNTSDELFGRDRVSATFHKAAANATSAEAVARNILYDLRHFTKTMPQSDDVTLVTARLV